jgi:hypothetical protein
MDGRLRTVLMAAVALGACGDDEPRMDRGARDASTVEARRARGDLNRPGAWRRFALPSSTGLTVGGMSVDAEGGRLLMPRDGGFDVWRADIRCPAGLLERKEGLAVRNGAAVGIPRQEPPVFEAAEVRRLCAAGSSLEADTLEKVVAGLRAGR